MYVRNLTEAIEAGLGDTPVVLVNGARQVGKSTLVQAVTAGTRGCRYITLDDASSLAAAHADPAAFLDLDAEHIILDEVQRAPELFLAIKASVDRNRRPGRFLLTGSADVLLLPRLAESLAGRMEILTLWPLSQGEIEGRREQFIDAVFSQRFRMPERSGQGFEPLVDRMLIGGYPPAIERSDNSRRGAWFGSYATTILQRDIRDLARIEGLTSIPRLLSLLATRVASILNHAELSRSLAIPQSTLKRYMALLETTFLLQLLPPWSPNLGKRLVKSPRICLVDTGLAAHLSGTTSARLRAEPVRTGALLENFVAMELRRQGGWSRTRTRLYHFRTHSGEEVDLILENDAGEVVGIEVKSARTVTTDHFRGLRVLEESLGSKFRRGIVLYTGSEPLPFGKKLTALPVDALWGYG